MSKKLAIPEKQISIAVTELTEQLLAQKQIKDLIINQCSYQIISGYLESSSYMFIDRILLTLLPLSKDRFIDICLPYLYSNYESLTAKTLARYIIFDKKLRGIRVCSGDDWRMKRCEYLPPPIFVQKYYTQNKIPFEMDELLVGSFYLQFTRCKIGLLFQSEIIDNSNLLNIYNRYNFDILSIAGNTIKHAKDSTSVRLGLKQKDLTSRLKTIARDTSVTVIYAGIKIAPSPTSYYFDRSYKIHGDEIMSQSKAYLGQQNTIIFVCKLGQALLRNLYKPTEEDDESDEICQLINKLQINKTIFYTSKIAQNGTSTQRNNKKYINQNLSQTEILLLHLWFIFKTVNQESPFVIPYPFTQKSLLLYNNLVKLENYCILSLESLVQTYRYKQGESSQLRLQVFSDLNHMLSYKASLFPKFVYVYTNDEEEISNLRSHPKYGQIICNCNLINPIAIEEKHVIQDKGQKLSAGQIKKIQAACSHVIKQRHQSVEDILKYFKSIGLSYSQIKYSFVEMFLKKIKKNVKLIPLYVFLLHSSKEEIIAQIKQAQLRLATNQQKILSIVQLDEIEKPNSSISEPSYQYKVEATKIYKLRLAKGSICHICQFLLNKKFIRSCPDCKESICFECIDNLTNHILTKLEQYRCIVCTKRCLCSKCLPQKSTKVIILEEPLKKLEQKKIDIFDNENFGCSFCQICQKEKSIRLQCIQCKKLVCYSCDRQSLVRIYDIQSPQRTNIWACNECRNPEIENEQPRMAQISIRNELLALSMNGMDIQKGRQENQIREIEKPPIKQKNQINEKKEKIEIEKNENRKAEKSPTKIHKKSSSKSKHKLHHKKKRSKISRRSSSSSESSQQSSSSKSLMSRSRSRDKSPQKRKKKSSTEVKQPQILHKIPSERKNQPQKQDHSQISPQKTNQIKFVALKQQKQVLQPEKMPIRQQKPQKSLWTISPKPEQQKNSHNTPQKQQYHFSKVKQQTYQNKNETKKTPPKPTSVSTSKKLFQVQSQSSYEQHSY